MSAKKNEFHEDDHKNADVEYTIFDDEEYDMMDDLLYGAFIVKDIERLREELNEPQRALFAKILRRTAEMFLKREKTAFNKGLIEGWSLWKEEQGKR